MSEDENVRGLAGLKSFWGLVGHIPSRGVFLAQFFGTSTLNSFLFGSIGGLLGQTVLGTGPTLPFLAGSWVGFSVSCVYVWKRDTDNAVVLCRRYPRLVRHYLASEFPLEFDDDSAVPTKEALLASLRLRSRVISATYALQPLTAEITQKRMESIKDQYASEE
eukprot:CAMPEP_0196732796 /NCGR_PEP_ID=MMETSP1091-20130531/12088_1 /TAXON_ID=302021 /ORGANISM="Rhodomonas sp., Strain CCMP768" /LENGTH=162 /DNA_ID=CAMNT_0042076107 /DNA_START=25 /DNA_END=513 /DNA_ORIENTATION=-